MILCKNTKYAKEKKYIHKIRKKNHAPHIDFE